jgi:thiol-disulfide isomerase/thioredoxin
MPIKKTAWAIIIASLLYTSCRHHDNITVHGSYPVGSGENLYVELLNIAETQLIDSVKIKKNGTFRFSLKLDHPELVLIRNAREQYINLLAFPDDVIRLEIPGQSFRTGYSVEGSVESEKIRQLVETVNKTKVRLDSILLALNALDDQDGPEAKNLVDSYQKVFSEQKRNNIRFVVENLSSLSSVYALYQRVADDVYIFNELRDLQYFKIVADSVKVKYPGSTLASSLASDVEQRIREYNNMLAISELSKLNISEAGMIDLSIENPEAKEISLGSLAGKVVLLNFWASWNNESKESNHRLKSIYNQYHARGFEIYSVSLDSDRNRWKNTIYFEEYPWIDVCELTYPNSYAASVYNVTSLPANFLIDREGNIVARNLAGKALATHLDNLL